MEPSLRPSESDQFSPRRILVGLALLVLGSTCIFFGGTDVVGQTFLISGSVLMVAGLYVFRAFRIGLQRRTEDDDIRKLYGTPKA